VTVILWILAIALLFVAGAFRISERTRKSLEENYKFLLADIPLVRQTEYAAGRRDTERLLVARPLKSEWKMIVTPKAGLALLLTARLDRHTWEIVIPATEIRDKTLEVYDLVTIKTAAYRDTGRILTDDEARELRQKSDGFLPHEYLLAEAKKVVDRTIELCYPNPHSNDLAIVDYSNEVIGDDALITQPTKTRRHRKTSRSNMSNTSTSATQRLLNFLQTGRDITVRQAQTRFGIDNVSGRVSELRQRGYAIYLNEKTNPWTGRKFRAYRLGTPTRRIVALGNAAKNDPFYA